MATIVNNTPNPPIDDRPVETRTNNNGLAIGLIVLLVVLLLLFAFGRGAFRSKTTNNGVSGSVNGGASVNVPSGNTGGQAQ